VLCELCLLHSHGGDLRQAAEVGGQLSRLAERLDTSAVVEAAFLRGGVALWSGDLDAAGAALAIALSSPVEPNQAERPYGVNPLVAARSFEALLRWVRADPDRAHAAQEQAVALAERIGRPFTIAHAAAFRARLLLLDERWEEAARVATRAVDLSEEYGFPRWQGTALVSRGRALAELGEGEPALEEIRRGLEILEQAGLRLGNSQLVSFLAAACLRLDRVDEGLAAVDSGLAHCRDTSERLFESELWRLRGELLLRRAPRWRAAIRDAEECQEKARAVARAQGAAMLERRAERCDPDAATARRRLAR